MNTKSPAQAVHDDIAADRYRRMLTEHRAFIDACIDRMLKNPIGDTTYTELARLDGLETGLRSIVCLFNETASDVAPSLAYLIKSRQEFFNQVLGKVPTH